MSQMGYLSDWGSCTSGCVRAQLEAGGVCAEVNGLAQEERPLPATAVNTDRVQEEIAVR